LKSWYYGENIVSSGPTFKGMKIKGDRIALCFDHDQGGLVGHDAQPLNWFTIAGMDGTFLAANAVIVGETVEVSAPGLHNPVAVHFAWDETAQPNFFNAAGLPAEPFRTENPTK
jgi:sialate O-acetylesterase